MGKGGHMSKGGRGLGKQALPPTPEEDDALLEMAITENAVLRKKAEDEAAGQEMRVRLASSDPHANQGELACYIGRHSIHRSQAVKRHFATELRGGCALGGWCCQSSSLWCTSCGCNYVWSGAEDEIADSIPLLLGLPRSPHDVPRKLPGELEAALALIERVSDGRKPLGQIILDNLSKEEADVVRAQLDRSWLVSLEYNNAWKMAVICFCVRGRSVGQVIDLEALSKFYARAGLPVVAAEVHAYGQVRKSPAKGPGALISRWLSRFDVEDTKMDWLTGVVLGYPLWTTVARYHCIPPTTMRRIPIIDDAAEEGILV